MTNIELLLKIVDEEWNNIKITFAEPWEIPWTVHAGERDDYEIYFLEKGKGRFVINGKEYPVSKGDIMFFSTKVENSFIADETPFRFVFITFKIDNLKNYVKINELNRILLQENSSIKFDNSEFIHEIFYKIQKEFYLKSQDYMFKIKLLLGDICSKLSEQLESSTLSGTKILSNKNSHVCINQVIIYIQENYDRNISLEELGELVNLHPRYLCTLFKQVSGKTITELLREIRIEKAKRLLLYTSLSITEIALEVGFGDSQYFSRIFNQSEEISPTAYRKSKNKQI